MFNKNHRNSHTGISCERYDLCYGIEWDNLARDIVNLTTPAFIDTNPDKIVHIQHKPMNCSNNEGLWLTSLVFYWDSVAPISLELINLVNHGEVDDVDQKGNTVSLPRSHVTCYAGQIGM